MSIESRPAIRFFAGSFFCEGIAIEADHADFKGEGNGARTNVAAQTISTSIKSDFYGELAGQLSALLADETDAVANAANTWALLFEMMPDLNWAGFYFLNTPDELVVGPFQGKPACVRIAVGRGVCGAAVERGQSIIVEDVHAFPGHIACDAASRSELVVPLINDGSVFGVLDLDSPTVARFDADDQPASSASPRSSLPPVPGKIDAQPSTAAMPLAAVTRDGGGICKRDGQRARVERVLRLDHGQQAPCNDGQETCSQSDGYGRRPISAWHGRPPSSFLRWIVDVGRNGITPPPEMFVSGFFQSCGRLVSNRADAPR